MTQTRLLLPILAAVLLLSLMAGCVLVLDGDKTVEAWKEEIRYRDPVAARAGATTADGRLSVLFLVMEEQADRLPVVMVISRLEADGFISQETASGSVEPGGRTPFRYRAGSLEVEAAPASGTWKRAAERDDLRLEILSGP